MSVLVVPVVSVLSVSIVSVLQYLLHQCYDLLSCVFYGFVICQC
jgi:hypothetical protein